MLPRRPALPITYIPSRVGDPITTLYEYSIGLILLYYTSPSNTAIETRPRLAVWRHLVLVLSLVVPTLVEGLFFKLLLRGISKLYMSKPFVPQKS